ncbi:MAG: hypothetical protein mread185_000197 [Mycoplasmataceae bacterium]|nr:MAG: hypothetical protein mread185_000197 [Mycoplasmataceae bacterium]
MTNNNPILENLQNRTVQQLPIKLIYAHNDYAVFDKGTTEFYGEEEEFISDQPIEDKVVWNKELTPKELKKLPVVFSCRLGMLFSEVFYTAYNKKKMRWALQSPAHQASLIDRLIDSMKTQAQLRLNEALTDVICNKDNYKENTGWEEVEADFVNLDSQDKAIAFLLKMKQVYDEMNEVTTKYNKGYQKPGDPNWHDVKTNCETPKSKVLTIDPKYMNGLVIYFLADVARDNDLNPHYLFKKVITRKLKNNVAYTIHDEKSVVYRIINDEGIEQEKILGSGTTKYAYDVDALGGMIPYTNSFALAVKIAE